MRHGAGFLWIGLLLGPSSSAWAFIERLYSLQEMLNESSFVSVGKVEVVNRERCAAVAALERSLKGQLEFQRVQMNIGLAGPQHSGYLMPLLEPGLPFIIFYMRDGMNMVGVVYCADTWFQLYGNDEPDKTKVWWRMSHIEIRFNRTYSGPTTELIKLTEDVLAGRAKPPGPNPLAPPIDVTKLPANEPRRLDDGLGGPDGLEAVPGWYVDDSWARPARLTIDDAQGRGKIMNIQCDGQPDKKLVVAIMLHLDLSQSPRFVADVDNSSDKPLSISVAFGPAPEWPMSEAPPATVPPGAKAATISFELTKPRFKCLASNWQYNQPLPNNGSIDKVMLLIEGMPEKGSVVLDRIRPARGGFQRQVDFPHGAGDARGVSWPDVNGDDRSDICLCCPDANLLILNEANGLKNLAAKLGVAAASRSAAWADYNADGRPDLVTGSFQLFTNADGKFHDDSKLLPAPPVRTAEGAGWIDYNGDGQPDILVASGEGGIRLFENTGKAPEWFRDVSDKAGLGANGLGKGKGGFVALADYDGDGYTDFFLGQGKGMLVHNEGDGTFKLDTRAGIELPGGPDYACGVAFADFDNDGDLDLFVPGPGKARLYRNNNDGTFTDIIDASGDLAKATEPSFAAAWGDVNCDGFLDLFVCHTRGPARLYLGDGKGGFGDVTVPAGVEKLTPAFAASFADIDDDGDLDLVVNLDNRAVVAVNDMDRAANCAPLTVRVQSKTGLIGAVVRVLDEKGKPMGLRELNGGEGCGGQAWPIAHFGLPLGNYQVSVCLASGKVAQRSVSVDAKGAKLQFAEGDFK